MNLIDDLEQRSLIGSVIINVQGADDMDYNNINVWVLTQSVANQYKVIMGLDDIKSVRRISSACTVVMMFYDINPGSVHQNLVAAMKAKGGNSKGWNIYPNSMLTARRSAVLYHIQKVQKDGILEK